MSKIILNKNFDLALRMVAVDKSFISEKIKDVVNLISPQIKQELNNYISKNYEDACDGEEIENLEIKDIENNWKFSLWSELLIIRKLDKNLKVVNTVELESKESILSGIEMMEYPDDNVVIAKFDEGKQNLDSISFDLSLHDSGYILEKTTSKETKAYFNDVDFDAKSKVELSKVLVAEELKQLNTLIEKDAYSYERSYEDDYDEEEDLQQ